MFHQLLSCDLAELRLYSNVADVLFILALYAKTKQRRVIIRNNRDYLVDNIQPNDDFFASLLCLSCITQEQRHLIQRRSSTRYKNEKLLYVMESVDERNFSNFIKSFRHTNQKTVETIMENGGGLNYTLFLKAFCLIIFSAIYIRPTVTKYYWPSETGKTGQSIPCPDKTRVCVGLS